MSDNVWSCKIGFADTDKLPKGADFPMRRAIEKAFIEITGKDPKFIFSGWGAKLTKTESEIVNGKN